MKASSTTSCKTNRGDKIILNIFGAAMYTKLISRMVFSKQEKKLVNSHFAAQLPSEITENYQETIRDAATFLKLVLVMKTSF